jgi:hypothetical protein
MVAQPNARRTPSLLQTETGTVHTTAISIVAITAVIFSLVDRSMTSSEHKANLSAALLRDRSC